MSMKTPICFIWMLLCVVVNVKAGDEPIILKKEKNTHQMPDDRFILGDPVITYDDRIVTIRFAVPCESLWVTVENESGIVVFSESPELNNDELVYSFEIRESESKSYHMEIKLDGVLYWGDFVMQ